ncbi:MAG: serine/threonine protein kinase [Polyangiaceae bacterium]|nr:serine/threonine protein kinase [Polyangiaceae bacterium]MCB9609392.1 serine/threonine protein kinase [Polyangiaceae bacterium]
MTAAEVTPPATDSAERIGRYEVISEIARGGMATVYLAHLGGLGGFRRLVAIKRLHPHLASEPQFVSMFLDEARLVAEIRHPNVVPTLDISDTMQGLCLVMEYIDGAPLTKLLKQAAKQKRGVNPRVAIRVMLDSLAGLHAAHELRDHEGLPLNLVHRDVSPHNLLVGSDGHTRLLDFGVARARQRLTQTRVGEMKGKLAYMAPEQASGRAIDRRTDVFAAGIVLWECLAGARLFYGANEADTLSRLMTQNIPPLSEFSQNTPSALDAVVGKALARDPDERFSSAADFAAELERVAEEYDLIGTFEEVSEAVEEAAGDILEERRMRARDANSSGINLKPFIPDISLPTLTHPASGRPETPTVPEAPAARPVAHSLLELTNTDLSAPEQRQPKKAWLLLAGAAALLVGASVTVLLARGGDEKPATPAAATTLEQPAQPSGVKFAESTPAPAAEKIPTEVEAAKATPSKEEDNGDTEAAAADGEEEAPAKSQGWSLAQWKRWKMQQAWKKAQQAKAAPKSGSSKASPPAAKTGGGVDVDNPYR